MAVFLIGGISGGEVLLLFGSKKIPDFARTLGKGIREFKKATEEIKKEINDNSKEVKKDIDEMKNNLQG